MPIKLMDAMRTGSPLWWCVRPGNFWLISANLQIERLFFA